MTRLSNDWTEDVNKSDMLEWVRIELNKIRISDFGEARIEIIIFPRKWGVKEE